MKTEFSVAVTTDSESGSVISVYFQVRRGKVSETREFADGAAYADYDKYGYLLGIELIAPCSVTVVDQLAAHEPVQLRRQTKKFMRQAGPPQLVA